MRIENSKFEQRFMPQILRNFYTWYLINFEKNYTQIEAN